MKSIFVNRKPLIGPWGGGNKFIIALYDHLPEFGYKIVENPYDQKTDYIFLQSPKPNNDCNFSINDAINLKNKNSNIKIIMRVNDNDARKNTAGVDNLWLECSKYVDTTIFVSNWMKEYYLKKGWHCKKNHVLYNGVNLDEFSI